MPDSPDLVELSPAEVVVATERAKSAKWGTLYRQYQVWRQLNCELVPDGPNGELTYALKEGVPTQPEPYLPAAAADVVLEPDELAEALRQAQATKWGAQRASRYLATAGQPGRAGAAPGVEQVQGWAWRQAQQVSARRRPSFTFELDAHNKRVFQLLCHYYAGSPRFEQLGEEWGFGLLSLGKGFALLGGVGVGKTILQQTFAANPRRPYGLVSARKVADEFLADLSASEGRRAPHVGNYQRLYRALADARALCFDDVGLEEKRQGSMGNWVYPMQRVLLDRYDAVQAGRLPLWATHLTSNYPLEPSEQTTAAGVLSLREQYGDQVADRIYELCNILHLGGPSRRG